MQIIKRILVATAATAAISLASSAFVEGTAEAHCGGHQGTCGVIYGITDQWCDYNNGHHMHNTAEYWGGCDFPILNCSPGPDCPCAQCNYSTPNACYVQSWTEDDGYTDDCYAH